MAGIYFAGAWSKRAEVAELAGRMGVPVALRWWDFPEGDRPAYLEACARQDLAGIDGASALCFVYDPDARGAWLEVGYALARGIHVLVYDPDHAERVAICPFFRLAQVNLAHNEEILRDLLQVYAGMKIPSTGAVRAGTLRAG